MLEYVGHMAGLEAGSIGQINFEYVGHMASSDAGSIVWKFWWPHK